MSPVLRAEWTKQRTIASTGWLLLGAVTLTVALTVVVTLATTYASAGSGQDVAVKVAIAAAPPSRKIR